MTDSSGTSGAWHPDPQSRYTQRWWDGTQWTDQVIDSAGVTTTDPLGIAATPAADATAVADSAPTFGAAPGFDATTASASPVGGDPAMSTGFIPPAPSGFAPAGAQPYTPTVQSSSSTTNGLAIAALVLGVGSLFFSWIPIINWFSIPFALGAIGCGIGGLSAAKKTGSGKGMALAGVITGVVALLIMVLVTVALVIAADDTADDFDINSDPSNGICNEDRFLQDPDC